MEYYVSWSCSAEKKIAFWKKNEFQSLINVVVNLVMEHAIVIILNKYMASIILTL